MPWKYTLGPALSYIFGALSLFVFLFLLLADSAPEVPAWFGYLFLVITFILMVIAAGWTAWSYAAFRRERRTQRENLAS